MFPLIEKLYEWIADDNSVEAANIKSKICVIFYVSNQINICARYNSPEGLNTLINFYLSNLTAPIDDHLTSLTEDLNEIEKWWKNPHWKVWSTSMHFMFWVFQKYGNPKYGESLSIPLCEFMNWEWNTKLIEAALNII